MSEAVAKKHGYELIDEYGVWNTNAGKFKTQKGAKVTDIALPEFSTRRTIAEFNVSLNPNGNQKYAAIFGLDFLVANGIDLINSQRMIEWNGVRVPIDDGTWAQQLHKCNALDKNKIADNAYKKIGPAEIVKLDNQQNFNVW